ncbi:hypothetical protein [Pseudomonas coronafaciens]|uniref:hypothetical protein n=1 Tax=Pseudomonas coronafaciens TaxID=53409 RepID=UPI0011C41CC1|nr:hypothetical protein [Pseudomonas coronafaciens]
MGKKLKLVTGVLRSGVFNEHGFAATAGMTDARFRKWPIAIRFKTAENRDEFCSGIKYVLHPDILRKIGFKSTIPRKALSKPTKNLRAS